MSTQAVTTLLREVAASDAFAAQLAVDPAILTGYDLSAEERRALLHEDEAALRALGVPADLAAAVHGMGPAETALARRMRTGLASSLHLAGDELRLGRDAGAGRPPAAP